MTPDKLFDYLDGKLSPADRQDLEEKLMSDAQLRAQFKIAREIHRASPNAREVILPSEDPAAIERGGRLGRRIATAAIVLVFLNVVIGIVVIAGKTKQVRGLTAQEAAMRQQLDTSLGAAGNRALPVPTFVEDEIRLTAPRAEWEATADKVSAAAEKCGGSAAKGLPDDAALTVVADVPSGKKSDFRRLLLGADAPAPTPSAEAVAPNERTIVQVRIAEARE